MMDETHLAVTTGLRVSGPRQGASSYAIAQNVRGDISGLGAVKTALANGDATINTAIMAGKAISDQLTGMKAKVVQVNQAGLDTVLGTVLLNDFVSLRDQIQTIVATAEFNGINPVNGSATATSV